MIKRLIKWLTGSPVSENRGPAQQRRRVSAYAALHARGMPTPTQKPRSGIETVGPRKNVPVRDRLVSDDTGTQEMLKLLDDSPLDPDEPMGIDPYNSGEFDRSRHWDTRFRN